MDTKLTNVDFGMDIKQLLKDVLDNDELIIDDADVILTGYNVIINADFVIPYTAYTEEKPKDIPSTLDIVHDLYAKYVIE